VVNSEINDRSAYQGQDNSIFLPYRRLSFFYGGYDFFCTQKHIVERARESTFRRAFYSLKKKLANENVKVKFSEGKG